MATYTFRLIFHRKRREPVRYIRVARARAEDDPERLQSMAEFVMKNRGTGYSESVYHECLRTLLESKGIRYRSQVNLYT